MPYSELAAGGVYLVGVALVVAWLLTRKERP